jgi:hypothetical protein
MAPTGDAGGFLGHRVDVLDDMTEIGLGQCGAAFLSHGDHSSILETANAQTATSGTMVITMPRANGHA